MERVVDLLREGKYVMYDNGECIRNVDIADVLIFPEYLEVWADQDNPEYLDFADINAVDKNRFEYNDGRSVVVICN